MGQRHQIYVKLPKKYYNKGNCNNKDSRVIGIHSQWLWGKTALELLQNLVVFCLNTEKYNPFTTHSEEAIDLLQGLYSLNVDKGYFARCHVLKEGTDNPLLGDNNNGITIIDLSDFTEDKTFDGDKPCTAKIKYCFLSLGFLECLSNKEIKTPNGVKSISDLFNETNEFHLKPINARDYIRLHYPDPKGSFECDASDEECPCLHDKKLKAEHIKANQEHELEIQELIKFFSNHENVKVLTLAEVQAIFPKMYKKAKKSSKE